MLIAILLAIILFLVGVLGFLIYAMQYEHNKKKQDRQRKNDARWQTVFDRTDLKKA